MVLYKFLTLILAVLMAISCTTATNKLSDTHLKDVYVSSINGNDMNPGTITQPVKTIKKAYSKVSNNGIIHLKNGKYVCESYSINTKDYGNLTIIGENRNKTIIELETTELSADFKRLFNITNIDLTIENLTMNKIIPTDYDAGIESKSIIAKNCTFTQNKNTILSSHNVILDHCLFKDNVHDFGAVWAVNLKATRCDFVFNEGPAFLLRGSDSSAIINYCNFIYKANHRSGAFISAWARNLTLDARYNYWSDFSAEEIPGKLEKNKDVNLKKFSYLPVLNESIDYVNPLDSLK